MVNYFINAQTKVDISKLEWSKPSSKSLNYSKVKAPKGYRLPTIQELYTAVEQGLFPNNYTFWSSDLSKEGCAWVGCFGLVKGVAICSDTNTIKNQTVFVREI
jgi:hypothetical protein